VRLFFRKPELHYLIHKSPSLIPTLHKINPIHVLLVSVNILYITLCSTSISLTTSLPIILSHLTVSYSTDFNFFIHATRPVNRIYLDLLEAYILVQYPLQIMKLLIINHSTTPSSIPDAFIQVQCVPLATEPGISLIIVTHMKILQRNLNRSTFVV